jgi:hypothetical protein
MLIWGALSDDRVILRSESCGTHDHILLSQNRDSPNLDGQVLVFISPRKWWPIYTPRHRVPFSSPPTTPRATVEVFEPASTRGSSSSCVRSSQGGYHRDSRLQHIFYCCVASPRTCLPNRAIGCKRHLLHCCVRALPGNGCFYASTVLALRKYSIVSNNVYLYTFAKFAENSTTFTTIKLT